MTEQRNTNKILHVGGSRSDRPSESLDPGLRLGISGVSTPKRPHPGMVMAARDPPSELQIARPGLHVALPRQTGGMASSFRLVFTVFRPQFQTQPDFRQAALGDPRHLFPGSSNSLPRVSKLLRSVSLHPRFSWAWRWWLLSETGHARSGDQTSG